MRKLTMGLLLLGGIMLFIRPAHAAPTADLLLTVTPNGTKSLTLSCSTVSSQRSFTVEVSAN